MEPVAGTLQARFPYAVVALDLQELPLTENGNRHLLVMCDYFSAYMEAVPLKDKSAKATAHAFVRKWVARHGVPMAVITDNALNFTAPDMKKLFDTLNIRPITTAPYSANQNGRVEHVNHQIQEVLSMLVSHDLQNTWDDQIDFALFSLRNRVNSSTGFTPHYMLHGFEMFTPLDRALEYTMSPYVETVDLNYIDEIQARLSLAWKQARDCQDKTHEAREKRHDAFKRVSTVNKGDHVLLQKMVMPGSHRKLGDRFSDPHEVVCVRGAILQVVPVAVPDAVPITVNQRNVKLFKSLTKQTPDVSSGSKMVTFADPNLEEEASSSEEEG